MKALAEQQEGIWISVKALDGDKPIDIKALTGENQRLDVKALDDAEGSSILSIKVVVSESEYYPIKAICPDGHVFDVKAIRIENAPKEIYDVKAFEMNYSSNP